MSKTCYIDVDSKFVSDLSEGILERNQDSVLVVPAVGGFTTYAPSKKNKNYRIKFDAIIPAEGIGGDGALCDFWCFIVMRIPKERIAKEYLKTEKEPPA